MFHEYDESLVQYKGNVIFERAKQDILDGHDVDGSIFVIISVKNGVIQLNELFFFVKDGDENGVLVVSFEFCSYLVFLVVLLSSTYTFMYFYLLTNISFIRIQNITGKDLLQDVFVESVVF